MTPAAHPDGAALPGPRRRQVSPGSGSPWRWPAAALLVIVAAAHIPVTGMHLAEAPYVGWGFVAVEVVCAVLAVVLVLHDDRRVWAAVGLVPAGAIAAYVLTRVVAFPQLADDVGNWAEPSGLVALTAEAALAGVWVAHVRVSSGTRARAVRPALAAVVLAVGLGLVALAATGEPSIGGMDGASAVSGFVAALPALHWSSFATSWQVRAWWLLFSWLVLCGYLASVVTARRHGVRTVHPARVVSFVTGIVVLVVTVCSALDTYAMALFWIHMVDHLLLIMVVPALLVLGHPITAVRAAASVHGEGRVVDAFASCRPIAALTHPAVGLALYAAVIVATHLTGFMDVMVQHGWLMGAEQWLYLLTGYVFLLPLIGSEPIRWRLPYLARCLLLLLAMAPDTVVGIVLLQTTSDPFPAMEGSHPLWALAAMQDVHTGGALMWVGGDGLMMLLGIGVVIALISHPGSDQIVGRRLEAVRRQTLLDHLVAAGGAVPAADGDVDEDEDEAMLDAYNEMLARLNGRPSGTAR